MAFYLQHLRCEVSYYFNRGWRKFMEDAHIATPLSDIKTYLFGLLDGHGGKEGLI